MIKDVNLWGLVPSSKLLGLSIYQNQHPVVYEHTNTTYKHFMLFFTKIIYIALYLLFNFILLLSVRLFVFYPNQIISKVEKSKCHSNDWYEMNHLLYKQTFHPDFFVNNFLVLYVFNRCFYECSILPSEWLLFCLSQ